MLLSDILRAINKIEDKITIVRLLNTKIKILQVDKFKQ